MSSLPVSSSDGRQSGRDGGRNGRRAAAASDPERRGRRPSHTHKPRPVRFVAQIELRAVPSGLPLNTGSVELMSATGTYGAHDPAPRYHPRGQRSKELSDDGCCDNRRVQCLIVIVGPVASGKSTLAGAVGARLRDEGQEVAVLDLDEAVEASGNWTELTADRFRNAQVAFGKHIAAWLAQGVDVIAHGPLFEPGAMEAILNNIPPATQVSYVRLTTTYEAALERVAADRNRQISRDPDFLRMSYDRIGPLLDALPAHWTFDTTSTPSDDIVEELTAAVLRQNPHQNTPKASDSPASTYP